MVTHNVHNVMHDGDLALEHGHIQIWDGGSFTRLFNFTLCFSFRHSVDYLPLKNQGWLLVPPGDHYTACPVSI